MIRQRISDIGIDFTGDHKFGEFELTLRYMHGDADRYTEELSIFKGDGLQRDLLTHVLDVLEHLGQYDLYSFSDYENALSQYGAPYDDKAEAREFIYDWTVPDTTNGGNTRAIIDGWKVTYYDGDNHAYTTRMIRAGEQDSQYIA